MRLPRPIRFVVAVLGLWIGARVVILSMPQPEPAAKHEVVAVQPVAEQRLHEPWLQASRFPAIAPAPMFVRSFAPALAAQSRDRGRAPGGDPARPPLVPALPSPTGLIPPPNPAGVTEALPPPARSASPADSRWSGSAYVFRRGKGGNALAAGGQLGGSQAGARIAYRIGALAAAARVSSPLDDASAAEAAVGIDWHPLGREPLRLSVERRIDLGGEGRNAWSAYGAGGFWNGLPGGFEVDGYAQAGVVGARRRDLFADGAVRAGRRIALGSHAVVLGGGVWGAAQPNVERLDVGPRATLSLPVAGATFSAAAEWRIRVAGDAQPGSAIAITLSADF